MANDLFRLTGAYAFSHDGFLIATAPFSNPAVQTLPGYGVSYVNPNATNPTLQFDHIGGFAIEGAVGYMVFSGTGKVTGSVNVYQHGLKGSDKPVTGTYTVVRRAVIAKKGKRLSAVYSGAISTVDSNGKVVDYYFVAANGFRELRFMITNFAGKNLAATGTMTKC